MWKLFHVVLQLPRGYTSACCVLPLCDIPGDIIYFRRPNNQNFDCQIGFYILPICQLTDFARHCFVLHDFMIFLSDDMPLPSPGIYSNFGWGILGMGSTLSFAFARVTRIFGWHDWMRRSVLCLNWCIYANKLSDFPKLQSGCLLRCIKY